MDGRSARKTGRTEQFATRITAELSDRIRKVAARDDLKIAEFLELALAAYERERGFLDSPFDIEEALKNNWNNASENIKRRFRDNF